MVGVAVTAITKADDVKVPNNFMMRSLVDQRGKAIAQRLCGHDLLAAFPINKLRGL